MADKPPTKTARMHARIEQLEEALRHLIGNANQPHAVTRARAVLDDTDV